MNLLFGKAKAYEGFPSRIARWFLRTVKICEKNPETMYEEFDRRWSLTLTHYTSEGCTGWCLCFEQPSTIYKWETSMESNTNLIESGWLYILPYLSLKKFVRIVTSCHRFYRFSLSPDIRRYSYKHNSLS